MSEFRYGFYLRPSAAMCRAQVEMHTILQHQYGLVAAGKFMPHATIKGFFETEVAESELVSRLDPVMAGRAPIEVYNGGPVAFGESAIVLTIQRLQDGSRNEALQSVHDAALDALLPTLARPDDHFTGREWKRERFEAHLTLAMADIPAGFAGEIFEFVNELGPVGPARFTADTFHLYRFSSDDWGGKWWETLTWELVHGWRLTGVVD
jgi:2'-5' RNA ligase